MSNDEMQAGRFKRWADCRRMAGAINRHLAAGGQVQVTTYTRSTVYGPRFHGKIVAGKTGVYAPRGKGRVDISLCGIRFIGGAR